MRAFLLLVFVAIVAGGFWMGWFNVSASKDSGKDMVKFTMDRDKVSQDTENIRHKAGVGTQDKSRDPAEKGVTPRGTAQASPENIQGTVKEVDTAAGSMVVSMASHQSVAFSVGSDAGIQVNGKKEGLGDLHAGDRVQVDYRTASGRNEVVTVAAVR